MRRFEQLIIRSRRESKSLSQQIIELPSRESHKTGRRPFSNYRNWYADENNNLENPYIGYLLRIKRRSRRDWMNPQMFEQIIRRIFPGQRVSCMSSDIRNRPMLCCKSEKQSMLQLVILIRLIQRRGTCAKISLHDLKRRRMTNVRSLGDHSGLLWVQSMNKIKLTGC
jgi:hypothetical protein